MNVSLYQAAAAMNAHARWQELISDNLASNSVPGFRKQDMSFSAVESGLMSGLNSARHVMPSSQSGVNLSPGELRASGGQTDLAIEGPGLFEVQLANGNHAYTRDGEFHLNAQGQIITKQGYLVMGDGGPIQLDANNPSPVTVSASGDVSQGDELKGHLRVVEFKQASQLTPIGGGNFLADKPGMLPVPSTISAVRQGFLETANTSPTTEMANLITSMRMFEANQKVLQTQDDRMGKVIVELGATS